MVRRLLGLTALLGFALAVASFVRRGAGRRRERVDLYYDDGKPRPQPKQEAELEDDDAA